MANEKRLIDANALDAQFRETKMIEIFPNWKELTSETKSELIRFGKALKEKMQNAPTVDAVEVVRCKDCKHRGTDYCIFHIKGEPADEELLKKLDNDFCSYGERKDND